jgi:hypothetical protein
MSSSWVQFPFIYDFDVRVVLSQLSKEIGRTITLSEVPDSEIKKWRTYHFDAIWLMGVWQTGEQSRILALNPNSSDESNGESDDVVSVSVFNRGLPRNRGARRRCRAGGIEKAAGTKRNQVNPRLRAEPHGSRSSLG